MKSRNTQLILAAGFAGAALVSAPFTAAAQNGNLKEFVEWTKTYKGAINFGSAGNGSGGHLAGELYKIVTGVKAQHIPYKGSGPALTALVGGEYHFNRDVFQRCL